MHTSLALDVGRRNDGETLLTAAGEIDLSNIDAFRQALAAAIADAAGTGDILTVDLADVEYVDSAAVNALYACAERIGKLVAHPLLMNIFTISGLSELVPVEAATPTAER